MNEGLAVAGRSGNPKRCRRPISSSAASSRRSSNTSGSWCRSTSSSPARSASAPNGDSALGYDMRKFHEMKLFLDSSGIKVPIVGNVYLLSKGVAKLFNSGKLAGCVVSDECCGRSRYAAGPDKGRSSARNWPPSSWRCSRGWASPPATWAASIRPRLRTDHRAGRELRAGRLEGILEGDPVPQPDEFFLFDHETHTGLSDADADQSPVPMSLKNPPKSKQVTLGYRFSAGCIAGVHPRQGAVSADEAVFRPLGQEAGSCARGLRWRRSSSCDLWLRGLRRLQPAGLRLSVPEGRAQRRPQRAVRRLGRGRCELDDKECFWARVYERPKYYGESERMLDRPATFFNARLNDTSSWAICSSS